MAAVSRVPVVNALTDEFHPCQILADLQTVAERRGALAGLTLTYLGDGANNMAHSYLLGGATAGMHVRIGSPEAFQPDPARARAGGGDRRGDRRLGAAGPPTPAAAADGADVLATDTWVSMGQEDEYDARIAPFLPYAVDEAALAPGRRRRRRAALPARLPRQGDRRRGHRRAAERGLGRGGEPAARPEGCC